MYLTAKSLFEIVLVSTPLDMGNALVMTIGSQCSSLNCRHKKSLSSLLGHCGGAYSILITNKVFFIHSRPKDEMKQIADVLTSMKT